MGVVLSLHMRIIRSGKVWLGTAPWHPTPIEGSTWQEVYEALLRAHSS